MELFAQEEWDGVVWVSQEFAGGVGWGCLGVPGIRDFDVAQWPVSLSLGESQIRKADLVRGTA